MQASSKAANHLCAVCAFLWLPSKTSETAATDQSATTRIAVAAAFKRTCTNGAGADRAGADGACSDDRASANGAFVDAAADAVENTSRLRRNASRAQAGGASTATPTATAHHGGDLVKGTHLLFSDVHLREFVFKLCDSHFESFFFGLFRHTSTLPCVKG